MAERMETIGPVRELQLMLRTLACIHWEIPYLTPNGVFGEETMEAVMIFQRLYDLPVSGAVDRPTWEAIAEAYTQACQKLAPPRGACLFPFASECVHAGQSTPMLMPIQAMFCALSQFFDGVMDASSNGTLDQATEENLRWIQRCGGLSETGELDRDTWDLLSRVYEMFVARSPKCAITGPS